jgi:hypothetical protein
VSFASPPEIELTSERGAARKCSASGSPRTTATA